MSDFEMTFDDAGRFAARMAAAPKIVEEEMTQGVDRLTLQGEAFAKAGWPVRTGHGRRSTAAKPATMAGGVVTGSYGTATPYAVPVEKGRGPIEAGPGKILRFVPKGSSTPIYRKRVGPARGHFMFRNSMQRLRPLIPREFRAVTGRIIARLGGG